MTIRLGRVDPDTKLAQSASACIDRLRDAQHGGQFGAVWCREARRMVCWQLRVRPLLRQC